MNTNDTPIRVEVEHLKWNTVVKDDKLHCFWKICVLEMERNFTISMVYNAKTVRGTFTIDTLEVRTNVREADCETAVLGTLNRGQHEFEESGRLPLQFEGEFNPFLALKAILSESGLGEVTEILLKF